MRLPPFIIIYIIQSSAPFHPLPLGGSGWVPTFSPLARVGSPFGRARVGFYFMSRYGILSISP